MITLVLRLLAGHHRADPVAQDLEADHPVGGLVDPFLKRSDLVQGLRLAERGAQLGLGGCVLRLLDDHGLGILEAAAECQGGGQGESGEQRAPVRLRIMTAGS